VEEANTAFYRALESGMLERMDDVWAHEDWVRCVHPGWDLLTGWIRVKQHASTSGRKVNELIARAYSTRHREHICCGVKQDIVRALIVDAGDYHDVGLSCCRTQQN